MRELKYTTERYETRYLKSWSVSVVSTIIWSIDNLLDQNLTLGLSRLITSRLRYSRSNLLCRMWANNLLVRVRRHL